MKRTVALALFIMAALMYNGNAAFAEETPVINAKAAVLVDMDSGRTLFAQNADAALPMASTTKVMTLLLALERCALDETVTVSRAAFGVPGTSIYLAEGEKLLMRDMLYGLMLASGNDAAVAIAEHVGGSLERFVQMMNERAAELGCANTTFVTPHGLPAAGHETTAREMALMACKVMEIPIAREIVATQRATIPWEGRAYERVLSNKNKLLATYEGAMGVKTGYTIAAGRCLVFCAEREGTRLLGVVLNCPDWFSESARLLDYGFEHFARVELLREGEIVRAVRVENGIHETVGARLSADLAAVLPIGQWPDIGIALEDEYPAGIRQGDRLGEATLHCMGEVVARVPLVAAQDVPVRDFRTELDRVLRHLPIAR